MFVVTDDGVLVADGQGSPAETKGLVDAIRKVTPKPITTSSSRPTTAITPPATPRFPAGVHYIIHPNSKAILDRQAARPTRAGAWKLPADAELVTDKKMIELGGEQMQILFLGRAHTGGDLAVWLPREKILFLSEIFLNRVFPAMRSAYPSRMAEGARSRRGDEGRDLCPRSRLHRSGPVSREDCASITRRSTAVIAEATRLHAAGVPVDEAIKQANWGDYGSWTLATSQAPIAIRKVYEELDGKLK